MTQVKSKRRRKDKSYKHGDSYINNKVLFRMRNII